ncbi:MAG: hypothetical protein SFW67_20735 [Myxococcaceae bacterium]|nr:hypothetical protein [Myxococcaceae bacterium]
MRKSMLLVATLFPVLVLAGPSAELDFGRTFDVVLGGDVAPAQKALTCTGVWSETPGRTPTGSAYTVSKCASSDAQVYLAGGKVFALGTKLEADLDSRKADTSFKRMKQGLTAAKCKVESRGQLLLGRCEGKAVILLLNWDSKTDTTSISMLYGVAEQLLPMVGAR